jgi:hypothetical protein
MTWLSTAKQARFFISPLLALWVSGAGCLLGCGSARADTTELRKHLRPGWTTMVSGHACSSESTHACCHKRNSNFGTVLSRHPGRWDWVAEAAPENTMSGCPMAINRSAVTAKSQTNIHKAQLTLSESPHPFEHLFEHATQLYSSLALSHREHTHLRCCVFLI